MIIHYSCQGIRRRSGIIFENTAVFKTIINSVKLVSEKNDWMPMQKHKVSMQVKHSGLTIYISVSIDPVRDPGLTFL